MTKRAFVPATLFLFALVVLPCQSQAQNLSEGWILTPKMETSAAFQEAFKSHMEFRVAQGEPWVWQTWECVVGETVGDFLVVSMDHSWEDFDVYENSDFAKVAGPHFGATVGPLLEDAQNGIMQGDTTFQNWPTDPAYEVNLIQLITFHLIPAKAMAFEEALAKIHQAITGANLPWYYGGSMPVVGGEGDTYSIVLLGESWADFAEPDPSMYQIMIDAYGQEEAMAIFASLGESYHKSESVMLRLRRDLSNIPEM